jgi:hypothetical protein
LNLRKFKLALLWSAITLLTFSLPFIIIMGFYGNPFIRSESEREVKQWLLTDGYTKENLLEVQGTYTLTPSCRYGARVRFKDEPEMDYYFKSCFNAITFVSTGNSTIIAKHKF